MSYLRMTCIKSDTADSFKELRLTMKPVKPFVNTVWYLLYRTANSLTKYGIGITGYLRAFKKKIIHPNLHIL